MFSFSVNVQKQHETVAWKQTVGMGGPSRTQSESTRDLFIIDDYRLTVNSGQLSQFFLLGLCRRTVQWTKNRFRWKGHPVLFDQTVIDE